MDDDDNKDSTSNDNDSAECLFERGTHSVNITGRQGFEPRKLGPHDSHTMNGVANLNNGSNSPIAQHSYSSFRDHIKSKASLAETFMKNLNRNNNNNGNTTNYNNLTNSNSIVESLNSDSLNILQANSKKLMDSARKQHKYLAKRKILMHYSDELNEKRLKEFERYRQEHDGNNNPNPEVQVQEEQPVPQSHNSFKIRLMESHLKANQEQQQKQREQNDCSNKNHMNPGGIDEEEALNLVQNNTQEYNKGRESIRTSASSDTTTEVEALDIDQTSESDVASTTNAERGCQMHDEDDINNNNTTKQEIVEIDNNNNSNLKNIALINAINRNMDHSKNRDYQLQSAPAGRTEETLRPHTQSHAESPHSSHHNDSEDDHNNNNDSNNNNHLQMDLSTVKSIATAEILCGLKSKVFKMEAIEASESSAAAPSRGLSEIKNAEW